MSQNRVEWVMYPVLIRHTDGETLEKHTKLVKRIAQKLLGRLPSCVHLEDLIQVGMLGLLEAVRNYDASKGASFETYASIRVRGSMLDEIRKCDWTPRSVHRNTRKVSKAIREIENQTGRDARNYEVAQSLNISLQEYHKLLQDTHGSKIAFLQDINALGEDLIDTNSAHFSPSPCDGLQQEAFKQSLSKSIQKLPERERLVLSLYYDEEMNLREVGDALGVSESRISQIHSQAMTKLKQSLKDWSISP